MMVADSTTRASSLRSAMIGPRSSSAKVIGSFHMAPGTPFAGARWPLWEVVLAVFLAVAAVLTPYWVEWLWRAVGVLR